MCAFKAAQSYVLKRRFPPNLAMVQGIAFHRLAADISMTGCTKEDVATVAIHEYERINPDSLWWAPGDDKAAAMVERRQTLINAATTLVSDHPAAIAMLEAHTTIATELKIRVDLGLSVLGEPAAFVGIVDRVTEDADGNLYVRDWKTSTKTKSQDQVDSDLEMSLYAWLVSQHFGRPVKACLYDMIVLKKRGVEPVILETTRDNSDMQSVVNRVTNICAQIDAGIYPPCDPTSWACSPKQCQMWVEECPYISERARQKFFDSIM